VDVVVERSGLTADIVSSILLVLELEGHVTACPGGRYVRGGLTVS
jgi:DNA processing protein